MGRSRSGGASGRGAAGEEDVAGFGAAVGGHGGGPVESVGVVVTIIIVRGSEDFGVGDVEGGWVRVHAETGGGGGDDADVAVGRGGGVGGAA